MKKIVALIGIFLLTISCSTETESDPNVHYELLAVDSVIMPTDFYVNVDNEIIIKFLKPSSCHSFDGFYYEKDGFTRTVAIQSFVVELPNCTTLTGEIVGKMLKFKPTETGTYLFKFWKGKNTSGDDVFEEISVEVQ